VRYIISFLEGVVTFISPCLLPLLPVYVTYFAGKDVQGGPKKVLTGAAGFVLGFTVVFTVLGAFAGLIGGFLNRYQMAVNIVTGLIVLLFGLNYLGLINIRMLNNTYSAKGGGAAPGFISSTLFGMVFSVSWTPCAGAFLGSALMLASQQGSAGYGVLMLLCYSLGLGAPFLISAVLINQLKTAFDIIKRHYRVVNIISGVFLTVIGVLMMTGYMGRFMAMLTF